MKRNLSLLALLVFTASCTADPGASLQLVGVVMPDQQCQYKEASKEFRFSGQFDPTMASEMAMYVRVRNNMNDKDSDKRTNDNNTFAGRIATKSS